MRSSTSPDASPAGERAVPPATPSFPADPDREEFERQRSHLLALAYQRVGSAEEAEDIVSEAWLRWFSATNVHNRGAFLVTVVTRLCIDHLKSAHTRRVSYVEDPMMGEAADSPFPDASQQVGEEDELRQGVAWLLERLAPAERAVLVLRCGFEYSHREIAAVLGIAEPYSRKLYGRAWEHLQFGRRRFTVAPTEHSELTRRLLAASRGGELRPLEKLLAAGLAA